MASNQLTFASRGPVSTICTLPIAPLILSPTMANLQISPYIISHCGTSVSLLYKSISPLKSSCICLSIVRRLDRLVIFHVFSKSCATSMLPLCSYKQIVTDKLLCSSSSHKVQSDLFRYIIISPLDINRPYYCTSIQI
jgi:hypothetical protein